MPIRTDAKTHRSIKGLRWLLLIGLIAFIVALVGLYWFGRAGRQTVPRAQPGGIDTPVDGDPDVITVAEGFERSFTEGDRTVFSIRGDRYSVQRSGTVHLEAVGIDFYREDGSHFGVVSDSAIWNPDTGEADLRGAVRVAGPDDLELESERLELARGGDVLVSRGEVAFRMGHTLEGTADRLRAVLPSKSFLLVGNVNAQSLEESPSPFRLECGRLLVERSRQLVRADSGVVLRRGRDVIEAKRIAAFYSEDQESLRFIRARFGVTARIRMEDGPQIDPDSRSSGPAWLDASGENLSLLFAPGGDAPERFDLEGGTGKAAQLVLKPVGGEPSRRLTAPWIIATYENGRPATAEARDGVVIEVTQAAQGNPSEAGDSNPEAQIVTADDALVSFAASGEVSAINLRGSVRLEDSQLVATGDRAEMAGGSEIIDVFGQPAVIESPRGHLEAPVIHFEKAEGLLRAEGGARTRLDEGQAQSLSSSPLGGGDGPIWVESDEAFLRDVPRAFLFRGAVRAWQGDSLILADSLRGDEEVGRVQANGNVRSVWSPQEDSKAISSPSAEGPDEPAEGPLEVVAGKMVYERGAARLVYEKNVFAEQAGRRLRCQEMTVLLVEEGGEAETILCRTETVVEDPRAGRTISGERARYDLANRRIEIVGEPVSILDAEGNELEGPRVIYEIDAGRVRVLPAEGTVEPTEEPTAAEPAETTSAGASSDVEDEVATDGTEQRVNSARPDDMKS